MSCLSAADCALRVRELRHRYGSFEALRGLSFEVQRGDIFGLVGPNGAGKTTLIRILATLLEPTSGTVEVGGWDIADNPDGARRSIGYMSDQAGVYERLTVREYLEFFAGACAVESETVVPAALELTDLDKLQDKLVQSMSKGMKQRLQVARVLLNDPAILLLDEPASDLDPRARIEMRDLLLELQAMGKTILLSSHILSELAELCTSVAIIDRGALVVAGPLGAIDHQLRGLEEPTASSHLRRLKVRVLGETGPATELLNDHPLVAQVEVHPHGHLIVSYDGTEKSVASLARSLIAGGVELTGLEPERTELERIFLDATQGELR